MDTKRSKLIYSLIGLFTFFAVISSLTQCKKNFSSESYAPSEAPLIKSVSANNGGLLYCSISGGCPLKITGERFTTKSVPYIGSYECKDISYSSDGTEINCNVGPALSGVYKVSVKNSGLQEAELDSSLSPTALDFSYASFLYIASMEDYSTNIPGKVYGYAQHPVTGALISIVGSPFSIAGHKGSYGIAMHPNNKYVYTTNWVSGSISMFKIDPLSGTLTSIATPINSLAAGGGSPVGIYFHPSGNFLYVTNQAGNSVSGFNVAEDGSLTRMTDSPFATPGASSLNNAVVSSDGKFLYAAFNGGNGGVFGFSIQPTTGSLTVIPGSPFLNTLDPAVTTNPGDSLTIHPNHKWLYVGLYDVRRTASWSIDQDTGVLTAIEKPTPNNATTGYLADHGAAAAVSNDGRYFYTTAFPGSSAVTDKKAIVFSIDQITGGLTYASEVFTTGGANDIKLDTNGTFAYTCNMKNPASISAYSVHKDTGALTPLSPASYSVTTTGSGPSNMVMQTNANKTLTTETPTAPAP